MVIPGVYNITFASRRVVKVCLPKTVFRIGEELVGWLTFDTEIPCMQVRLMAYICFLMLLSLPR